MTFRPGSEADVAAMLEIMAANGDATPAPVERYLRHLVRRGTTRVAAADEAIVGFGATVDTGRSTHLADLFVRPERHGGGIGGLLLAAVFGDAWPRSTFASADPRALPLYVRAGMTVLWPNLYLSGDPASLPSAPSDHVAAPAALAEVASLERAWIGVDRGPDLDYRAQLPDVRPFIVSVSGRPVATGLGRAKLDGVGRWMAHAVVAPSADPEPALLAAMRFGLAGASVGGACVLGPSPLVRRLLDAGFRIVDRDTFLSSDPTLLDPAREIVNTAFL